MSAQIRKTRVVAITLLMFLSLVLVVTGCAQGQPTVLVFTGKGSASAKEMKTTIDKLEKKYSGKVTFKTINMDDPANKGEIAKYHVSMNPTIIILNTEGKVKETFMGKAQDEMLMMAIESYIPGKKPSGSTTTPQMPAPSLPPSSVPSNLQTIPVTPSQ